MPIKSTNIPGLLVAGCETTLSKLFFAKAGEGYGETIQQHGKTLAADTLQSMNTDIAEVVVIDVPRGGVPLGIATAAVFKDELKNTNVTYVSSQTKTNPDQLFPETVLSKDIDHLVIADGVVGSGATIIDHLKQAPLDNINQITIISNISAEFGARAIAEYGFEQGIEINHITGKLVEEDLCAWHELDCGKRVYFVGFNPETGYDMGIPDFGDAIQPQSPKL